MPAKERDLFDGIASFTALHAAALRAVRGKRAKPGASAFLANLEKEVLRLERELRNDRYRPGRYKTIEIRDPKHRIVPAAPFRDRVVHQAFCAICEPVFERGFIDDSYANRKGKGTHRAIARYEAFRDRFRYVLRCDIYRYLNCLRRAWRCGRCAAGQSGGGRGWAQLPAAPGAAQRGWREQLVHQCYGAPVGAASAWAGRACA